MFNLKLSIPDVLRLELKTTFIELKVLKLHNLFNFSIFSSEKTVSLKVERFI